MPNRYQAAWGVLLSCQHRRYCEMLQHLSSCREVFCFFLGALLVLLGRCCFWKQPHHAPAKQFRLLWQFCLLAANRRYAQAGLGTVFKSPGGFTPFMSCLLVTLTEQATRCMNAPALQWSTLYAASSMPQDCSTHCTSEKAASVNDQMV